MSSFGAHRPHLARDAGYARVATIIGILFRCIDLRGGALALRGRVEASWVAETPGVDSRRVRRARADLAR